MSSLQETGEYSETNFLRIKKKNKQTMHLIWLKIIYLAIILKVLKINILFDNLMIQFLTGRFKLSNRDAGFPVLMYEVSKLKFKKNLNLRIEGLNWGCFLVNFIGHWKKVCITESPWKNGESKEPFIEDNIRDVLIYQNIFHQCDCGHTSKIR